ncbi:rRNA-processing protein bfr2 [Oleoguttula sp. CCFEE 5521]
MAPWTSTFDDLDDIVPIEIDPEADFPDSDSEASGSESDGAAARDHYVDVGKSKLRKSKEIALGPQYRGSRISRDAALEDDEDDPFAKGFDDEDSEMEDGLNGAAQDSEDSEEEDEDDEDPDTDATDMSDGSADGQAPGLDVDDQEALRKQMRSVASVSAAVQTYIMRGHLIKKQRAAFDSLLNTRIKLQKSLVEANTLVALDISSLEAQDDDVTNAIASAETAVFKLWSSLTTFREEITAARSGEKRKRSTLSQKTSTSRLLSYAQEQEADAIVWRKAVLQKWSSKVKANAPTVDSQKSRLNNNVHETTIIDVLNEHLSAPERLLKRAHTPRSCAPMQSAKRVIEDLTIYDDADFYGLLLKELLDSKSSADSTAAASVDVGTFSAVRKEAKTKRNVDVKASKGRKLKYTVHEKLQNFMAPEELGTWGQKQTDDLFGSLFGRRLMLDEADGADDNIDEDVLDPEAATLLFGR